MSSSAAAKSGSVMSHPVGASQQNEIRQTADEVNHVGHFLCGSRCCVLCVAVGFYKSIRTSLGRSRWNMPSQESWPQACLCI
jgi:hypothetical protein